MSSRQCFWIDPLQKVEPGGKWIPSLVIEGKAGHSPMRGDPAKLQTPWYWGYTYEQALGACRAANEDLELSEDEVLEIVLSSMRAT